MKLITFYNRWQRTTNLNVTWLILLYRTEFVIGHALNNSLSIYQTGRSSTF